MPSFRRAQLRGSEELFTPTRTENGEPPAVREHPAPAPVARPSVSAPAVSGAPEGRLVRLTDDEVQTLAEAVQRLKFPGHKATNKPPVEEFERLEELRQKLLSVL
ncbi:MAG TPA: hypothetical protein VFC09_07735 [Candidatus Dormibacteraeota bacterium]|nr:hypothetical protein [Candidatus Dormibacteraeota bacterium]